MLSRRPEERPSLDEVFVHLAGCEEEIFGSSGARLALTASGSRPGLGFPASSRPHSIGALQVPYTIVAPQPMVPGITPRPHVPSSSGTPVITGMTPRPMATTHPPQVGQRSSFPVSVVIALVAVLMSVGAIGIWFAKTRLHGEAKNTTAGTGTAATTAAPSVQPETPTFFMLHVDSNPRGAEVFGDDGRSYGLTPTDVKIERATVANGTRTFQLKKDGYITTAVAQSATNDDKVETTVQLAPEPARIVKAPTHGPGGAKQPAGGGTKPPPANTQQGDLDIRLRR
jgi:hypothetical protein